MKSFTDIFRHWETTITADGERIVKGVVEKQADDRIAVENLLAELGVKRREPGASISATGERIILGIATWNGQDMRFLDHLIEGAERSRLLNTVEIFFVDDAWASQAQVGEFLPGLDLDSVFGPPLVGIWKDGQPVACACGHQGYRAVLQFFGLPPVALSSR